MTDIIIVDFVGTLFPNRFVFSEGGFDPVLANVLNVLCSKHGFRLVVSSTMSEQGRSECLRKLNDTGIEGDPLYAESWTTHDIKPLPHGRQRQLESWVERHKSDIGRLLIFDDEHVSFDSPIYDSFFRCDEDDGLPKYLLTEIYAEYPDILGRETP